MDAPILWLFLFTALLLGWLLGRYDFLKSKKRKPKPVETFQVKNRLQMLFDSYSDSAIDKMLQSLDVTSETFSTHISIGKHFRKQGEVEKAILVHQNLMAHPELSQKNGEIVTFELAKDYKAAGLFDRAVTLLEQLSHSKEFQYDANILLLDIREKERDWVAAIELARRIDLKRFPDIRTNLSQYLCELAAERLRESLVRESEQLFKQALQINKHCVRAILGLADIEMFRDDYAQAIRYLKQVPELSPEDADLIYPSLLKCTIETNSFNQYQSYLDEIFKKTGQVSAIIAKANAIKVQEDEKAAADFVREQFQASPKLTLLKYLSELLTVEEWASESLSRKVIEVLFQEGESSSKYRCNSCGFESSQLLWHCPGCKSWQTIKPTIEYVKRS